MERILSRFPVRPVFCFAYGSSVFKQATNMAASANRMLDLILAVDDSHGFHTENLKANPNDYPLSLRVAGASAITRIQEEFGAKVYFNTLVDVEPSLLAGVDNLAVVPSKLKYGVVSVDHLKRDLMQWESLYVAGRMQKPIRVLHCDNPDIMGVWQPRNLEMACSAASLFSSHAQYVRRKTRDEPCADISVAKTEFYERIAMFSYAGDIRMGVAENNNKIQDLVAGCFEEWNKMYEPVLNRIPGLYVRDDSFTLRPSSSNVQTWFSVLPKDIRDDVCELLDSTEENALQSASFVGAFGDTLRDIVRESSTAQTMKGFVSSGPIKSFVYVSEKVKKALASQPKSAAAQMS
ncbi:mitochondrial mitochondrial matrix protein Mmp37/Tam41 [Andalucia godoyi]|uniref:Phosphatidate cytidylyltransferase, mitochondrial n=1 Tax=Andalucia godoyi TaxID=505711 RepID=A0A8K0F2D5_ANDGO|nr:mitochondrial mitochondrial matrix protein Mmp37/Tam41 [Andalucia godoyi]|eukprot:ANDGO_04494.mRNA.1 mitochondrial mitochondrial matrix protein Mmp37/Tam41